MSVNKGEIVGLVLQPGRTVVEKIDGTLEGAAIYKTNLNDEGEPSDRPFIDDPHPDDDRLYCYDIRETRNALGLVTFSCAYFGLAESGGKWSTPEISYAGGTSAEPIETHPDFANLTASSNYSYDDNGGFLGFTGGDLVGVTNYLVPSSTITISRWRDTPPEIGTRVRRFATLPPQFKGFPVPNDIPEWLLIDSPYRKVGKFYQVNDVFMASGPDGWNSDIYP